MNGKELKNSLLHDMALPNDIQQFTQVPNLMRNLQALWLPLASRVVPTGVDAIIHTALNIRGEAVADDQHIASGGIFATRKGCIEEGSLGFRRLHFFRNDQFR